MLKISIINRSGRAIPRQFLSRWVAKMARLAARRKVTGFKGKELVIVFVTSAEARRLNRGFRRRDYATGVLSFEAIGPGGLGELVLCPQVLKRQAREHGLLVREELGYMVLHGFLHLLGYDHEKSERAAKRMFALQDRMFDEMLVLTRRR